MAADNKTLGRFQLTGIPMAPKGVPQIEVTFDIDANGIVNVSAKDLGTNNIQNVVIKSTTNMSDAEIDRAVKEAEQFAAEDQKKEELITARNDADSIIYQTEKTMKENADKVSDADRQNVENAVSELRNVMNGNDAAAIRAASEKVSEAFYPIAQKMYAQTGNNQSGDAAQNMGGDPNMGSNPGTGTGNDDNVVDADFTVED